MESKVTLTNQITLNTEQEVKKNFLGENIKK